MKDETLYRVCILFSAVSIVCFFVFSYLTEPNQVEISSIGRNDIGKIVKINGEVRDRYLTEDGHLLFHVKGETGEIGAVIFKGQFSGRGFNLDSLNDGKKIKIEGEIGTSPQGELQILPERIVI